MTMRKQVRRTGRSILVLTGMLSCAALMTAAPMAWSHDAGQLTKEEAAKVFPAKHRQESRAAWHADSKCPPVAGVPF